MSFSNELSTVYSATPSSSTQSGSDVLGVGYTQYRSNGEQTIFYGVSGAFGAGSGAFGEEPVNMDMRVGAQAGLGRVVDARTLLQAAQIFKVLGRKASAARLSEIAEIIGQRVSYINEHRYEADVYFFRDLGKALGGLSAKQAFRVQQVLDSPLYNIGSRQTGSEVGAAVDIGYGDMLIDVEGESLGRSTYARVFATTAGMVGKTNVVGYANVGCALIEEAAQVYTASVGSGSCDTFITAHAGARASLDHSATWNTSAGFDLSPTVLRGDEGGLYSITTDFVVESRMAVGSRVLWGAYYSNGYSETMNQGGARAWSLSTDLTVFLL